MHLLRKVCSELWAKLYVVTSNHKERLEISNSRIKYLFSFFLNNYLAYAKGGNAYSLVQFRLYVNAPLTEQERKANPKGHLSKDLTLK